MNKFTPKNKFSDAFNKKVVCIFTKKEKYIKMSLIANAKAKALKGNVSEAFKNEAGAIDLASIMVGIIVIGLIGGVIAATVFAVIPWAQDNAAKQQLDSVASAQAAYVGLSADKGDAKFGGGDASATYTKTAVVGADGVVADKLFDGGASAKVAVGSWGSGSGAHYAAGVKSQSNKVFYITDTKTQPTTDTGTVADANAEKVVASIR
jgi:type II secretory pathway pseudopilin PulG